MARPQAKTNNSNKSSQKPLEAPPTAAQPVANVAPVKQEAPVTQASAPSQQAPVQQAATPAPARGAPSEEQIAHRAYELFLARGGEHGNHDADWIQAERDLRLGR